MHRVRTTLLTLAAIAALAPSLTFALDSEGGDGGHDSGEGSTPAAQHQPTVGVLYDDAHDDEVSVVQAQPTLKFKLPGICKLLGC